MKIAMIERGEAYCTWASCPSGKGLVCKTRVEGSIPSDASNIDEEDLCGLINAHVMEW